MAASDVFDARLKLAARRSYELGRLQGALLRGAAAALLATPGFLFCSAQAPWAAICLAGFGLTVVAGRVRGGVYEEGSRSGAVAGILPCLLPAGIRAIDPELCTMLFSNGLWICGIGGAAAGVILGLRGRLADGLQFWAPALAAFGFAGSLGCLPAGGLGFAGLALGLIAGAAPVLAVRKTVV
jgi:hypothetical protein